MAAVADRSGVTRTAPNFSVRSSAFFSSIANRLASARRNSGQTGASPSFVEVRPASTAGTTIASVRVGASVACFSACSAFLIQDRDSLELALRAFRHCRDGRLSTLRRAIKLRFTGLLGLLVCELKLKLGRADTALFSRGCC